MNNKSITMLVNETKNKLVQTCNSSTLPVCVLELILENLYKEVSLLAKKQLQEDELYFANNMNIVANKEPVKEDLTKQDIVEDVEEIDEN